MKKNRFHIAVAIFAGCLFIAVSTVHACVRAGTPHDAHAHSDVQAAGLVQVSYSEIPGGDCGCNSIRDRLLSSAPEWSTHRTGSTADFQTKPAVAGLPLIETGTFSAEQLPRRRGSAIGQALYLSNSVLRI